MKKDQQSPKTKKQNNNLHPISQKEEQLDKENNKQEQKSDNTKKKDRELKEKELELKSKLLKKPKELLDFDANAHFKENISHTDKNCLEPITEKSYYCINCKHSECPLFKENANQKEHLLIKRAKCIFYDKDFFIPVENSINEALNFNQFKKDIKENLSNSINGLKDELDKLKERKFQEIDTFFNETEKYLLELKNKYLNVKQSIEDYYKVNQKFFNIEICKENNNNSNIKNEQKEKKLAKSEYITNEQIPHLNINSDCIFESYNSNKDIENTVFLMNFELMNLCETKNLEIIELIKNLRIRLLLFNDTIQQDYLKDIDIISKFFDLGKKAEKIDDYYWDIVMRTKKYSGMIQQFKETITDILHNAGNLEKIKDLIDIFDSKLKKNNKVIYDQNYFKENNDMNNKTYRGPGSPNNDRSSRRRNPSFSNTRSNSKSRLYTQRGKSASRLKKVQTDSKGQLLKNNYGTLTLSNDLGLMKLQENKNENLKTEIGSPIKPQGNLEAKKSTPFSVFHRALSFKNIAPEDIILDQRVLERFFAYSVSELFSKAFLPLDPEDEANYIAVNKDNVYLLRNLINRPNLKNILDPMNANMNNTQSNKSKKPRGNSSKKNKNMSYNTNTLANKFGAFNIANIKNAAIFNNLKNSPGFNNMFNNMKANNNNLDRFEQDKFDSSLYNVKSVSYLANYTNRYNSLKEIAKPIIGTNQIQLFMNNQKIIRKTTSLNKEEHGYNLFPEGCRHILIEDNLYIIGGTNHVRIPISIVLEYNITSGALKRLSDLNTSHSYHTVEYLENYDSLLCIGGENSSSCEIMNLENKKWYKLPSLNIPRANANIYLNNITGEIFVLFGICGIISEKSNNYSDSIEVLVINDLSQGWLRIDYYKTPGLNLKVNYCMTIPFTRNQLLVYGGSNMRSFRQNIYALFHMIRNECIKVDTQTMELIKLEEKKSRLVDLALTKLG